MKEFEVNAISIRANDGDYGIYNLFTYDNFETLDDCYKQLHIWSNHYGDTIMQYSIKQGNQVIISETLISGLGVHIFINDSKTTKELLERMRLKFVKELEEKLGLENN